MTMRIRYLFAFFGLILGCMIANGQNINVKYFGLNATDLSASVHSRTDRNGRKCALIKVSLASEGAVFEGNVVGDVQNKAGEYWVYVTEGTKMLHIKHPKVEPLMVDFGNYSNDKIMGNCTYTLQLKLALMSNNSENRAINNDVLKQELDDAFEKGHYQTLYDLALENSENSYAQFALGVIAENGYLGNVNKKEAYNWYLKSAQQGDIDAQNCVGVCYADGEGVVKNLTEAVKWFRRAAEKGNIAAQCNLAMYLLEENKSSKNKEESLKWLEKSADNGFSLAQAILGGWYLTGHNVEADHKKAAALFEKSSDAGQPIGQYGYGMCLINGVGTKKDRKKGIELLKKAAQEGVEEAIESLAEMKIKWR